MSPIKSKNKTLVFIKLDALFLSFIEDVFLVYSFYQYYFIDSLNIVANFFFDRKCFYNQLTDELLINELINYFHFNNNILDYLASLDKKQYTLVLIAYRSEELLETFNNYFNYDYVIGLNKNNNHCKSFSKLLLYSIEKSLLKSSILITDHWEINLHSKIKKLIVTGSMFKIIINMMVHKNIEIIQSVNILQNQWIYNILFSIQNKKLSRSLLYPLFLINIFIDLSIIIRIFFMNSFILMVILFSVNIFLFNFNKLINPINIFLEISLLTVIQINNLINVYNILQCFNPIFYYNTIQIYYLNNGILKGFGSFRVGIFLFLLMNYIWLNNIFIIIIQFIYISLFLKYPKQSFINIKKFKWLFYFLNTILFIFL